MPHDKTRRLWAANGEAIAAIREARGESLSTFATKVLVSHSYLSNIEAGRRPGSPEVLKRIADALGVSLAAITYPSSESVPA